MIGLWRDTNDKGKAYWMTLAIRRFSLLLICALGLLTIPDSALAEPTPNGVPGNWRLLFNEDFSGNGLTTSFWTAGWQNNGISGPMSGQCMNSSFVSQPGNGYLYLELKRQANTCEWRGERASVENTGAMVETNPGDGVSGHTGFAYSYGYVEWQVYLRASRL